MLNLSKLKKHLKFLFVSIAFLILILCCRVSQAQIGVTWTAHSATVSSLWWSIAYGNGLFVAVSKSGTINGVMTSTDGKSWTSGNCGNTNSWNSVTYGNGKFVAVAVAGTNRVMTSPDGSNWTTQTPPEDNNWSSVTYGNNTFVAVASYNGSGNMVMTSPDGINWTSRVAAANISWYSVTFGKGLFVAVAINASGSGVMTSPDGNIWTLQTILNNNNNNNNWASVVYGNNIFVAVAYTGTNNRVMTSPDGFNWTIGNSAADNTWFSITYGNGLFVAVAYNNIIAGTKVMTSPDGIAWTLRTSVPNYSWRAVTYQNGIFVAVAQSSNQVMTSGTFGVLPVSLLSFTGKNNISTNELNWQTASENNNHHFDIESSSNGKVFEKIGRVEGAGNSSTTKTYKFIDGSPLAGTSYYRLKQTDIDGRFTYSKIINIKRETGNLVSIYPNPASNVVNLQTNGKYLGSTGQLFSIQGKLLKNILITKNVQQINIKELPRNTYLIKLKDGATIKLVKE